MTDDFDRKLDRIGNRIKAVNERFERRIKQAEERRSQDHLRRLEFQVPAEEAQAQDDRQLARWEHLLQKCLRRQTGE
jgi:hypothetical protein